MFHEIRCNECDERKLKLILSNQKYGFVREIQLYCEYCELSGLDPVKKTTYTSLRLKTEEKCPDSDSEIEEKCSDSESGTEELPDAKVKSKEKCTSFELNLQTTLAFTYVGMGFKDAEKFAMVLGIVYPSKQGFADMKKVIHKASVETVQKCLEKARSLSKKFYLDISVEDGNSKKDCVEGIVSYDGSWLTRGHKSKYGFAAAIDYGSGFVLDYEVLSKFCLVCSKAKIDLGGDSPDFAVWFQGHEKYCSQNHHESSGAMERVAAEKIWKRTEAYGFRFTEMISDGDASTFSHLSKLKVYGEDVIIRKEECINHVHRR